MTDLNSNTFLHTKDNQTKAYKILKEFLKLKLTERDDYLRALYSNVEGTNKWKLKHEQPTPKTYDRY